MKNYEKYAEEIKKNEWGNTCKDFIEPIILKPNECNGNCTYCSCYDEDFGCTMPSVDKLYACPLFADEDELKEMFEVNYE